MGADGIRYRPDHAEAFFRQLDEWNDAGEYTRCVTALDAIPETQRDYRVSCALARALENYAIHGDLGESTPEAGGEEALKRAVQILESVREEGQDTAEWNMRMAIGYQHLRGQEEHAVPYAKRWAELDPEDENAPAVIRACGEAAAPREEEPDIPEVSEEKEMNAVRKHITKYFGEFKQVFHERVARDIHVDICAVPPSGKRDYYTLVTMGMGARRMNAPEGEPDRVELAIALPKDWKLDRKSLREGQWYWPIRLLKQMARLPVYHYGSLGRGHTLSNSKPEPFAENTQLCACILTDLQDVREGARVCVLPGGEEVSFYQVVPLYEDELSYKLEHGPDALLDKMAGVGPVVDLERQDVLSGEEGSGARDDAQPRLGAIREKGLPVDESAAYQHMAIYLRWCIEQDLMSEEFLAQYGEVAQKVRTDPAGTDLREFLRDELDGQLTDSLFNSQGRDFTEYYYGDSPNYPSDIDDYALSYFGPDRYYSDEFKNEASLFLPYDEDGYQAIAKVIGERFANWQSQHFDESTLGPGGTARALMDYLNCECTYFPAMKDDDPIRSAYGYARRLAVRGGYVPVLIRADDKKLMECLAKNADPDSRSGGSFDPDNVAEYRRDLLCAPAGDGKAVLDGRIGWRKAEAGKRGRAWEEVLGEIKGGYCNCSLEIYWDEKTEMTHPLILARIPVKNPWEIFAYLPFGNRNECPDTPDLAAVAKYWYERYGAVPAVVSHNELEFLLPAPVPGEQAMDLAAEQYGFCPDAVADASEEATVGALADTLSHSTVWYFWWA